MLRLAPHLPDPPVGVGPQFDGPLDQAQEEPPVVVVGRAAPGVPLPAQVEELTEGVELGLLGRAIPDSNRAGAAV